MKYEDKGKSVENNRKSDFEIDPLFLNRWSPRVIDPEPIREEDLKAIFEAARWSMSCFNDQPWMIGYAVSESDREKFLSFLAEGNQVWAKSAPVIGVIFARKNFKHNNKPNRWAEFDCGAAWMALTMQARMFGLYTHGMGGFNAETAHEVLKVPDDKYKALCVFTLGRYGDPRTVPEDIRKREKPNDRVSQSEFVFEGQYLK